MLVPNIPIISFPIFHYDIASVTYRHLMTLCHLIFKVFDKEITQELEKIIKNKSIIRIINHIKL